MASVFFGALTVIPLFFFFRKMFDLKIVVVACIFFVLSPRIGQYSSDVLREPLFWLLSMTALWMGWKGISDKSWIFIALSSLFTGLACFTRMEGVGVIMILCLWSGWLLLYRERNIKHFFIFVIVFFISFPLIFAAPLYYVKSKTGKWEMGHVLSKIPAMISKDSKAIDSGNERSPARFGTTGAEDIIKNKYTFFVWEVFYKFFRSFHVVLIPLLLFGIFRRRTIPYSKDEIPVLIWCSVFFVVALLYAFKESYVSTRHGLLMGIPSLLWVSIGFFELNAWLETFLKNRKWPAKHSRHIMVYVLAVICLVMLVKTLSPSNQDKLEMKQAGIYLKSMGYSNQRFAVQPRISRLVFYMDSEYVDIPIPTDHVALGEFLRNQNVTYFIVDEKTIDKSVKGFGEYSGSLNLEKIRIPEFEKYKEYSFVLYRIRK